MSVRKIIFAVGAAIVIIYAVALWISKLRTDECALDVEEWLTGEFAPMNTGEVFSVAIHTDVAIERLESSATYIRWRKYVRIRKDVEWVVDGRHDENIITSQGKKWGEAQDDVILNECESDGNRIICVTTRNDNMMSGGRYAGIRPIGTFYVMRIISKQKYDDVYGGNLIILIESSFFGFPMPDKWSLERHLKNNGAVT